jgi:hypothetical protein
MLLSPTVTILNQRPLFSPASLPGLAAWYDASDSATVLTTVSPDVPAADGQTVRRWLSRHNPAVFWDQSTLINQLKLSAGKIESTVSASIMTSNLNNSANMTIFCVAQRISSPTNIFGNITALVGGSSGNGLGGGYEVIHDNTSFLSVIRSGGSANNANSARDNNLNILTTVGQSGAFIRHRKNGIQSETATAVNAPTNLAFWLNGGNTSFESRGAAFYCELIFCNQVLSAADIAKTETYLQRKWGTPALP